MLRHNPLRSLLMTVVPVGTPVDDNIATKWWDGSLGWSVGPEMGFNSFHMNPWVNVAILAGCRQGLITKCLQPRDCMIPPQLRLRS